MNEFSMVQSFSQTIGRTIINGAKWNHSSTRTYHNTRQPSMDIRHAITQQTHTSLAYFHHTPSHLHDTIHTSMTHDTTHTSMTQHTHFHHTSITQHTHLHDTTHTHLHHTFILLHNTHILSHLTSHTPFHITDSLCPHSLAQRQCHSTYVCAWMAGELC